MTMHRTLEEPQIREDVKAILVEITEGKASGVGDADRLREDLGLDSLDSMELLSCISEKYDVYIEPQDAAGIRTFGEIIEFVAKTLQSANEAEARPA